MTLHGPAGFPPQGFSPGAQGQSAEQEPGSHSVGAASSNVGRRSDDSKTSLPLVVMTGEQSAEEQKRWCKVGLELLAALFSNHRIG
jgi:hypothetical protein